eukprot:2168177-Rhodomonas_salina.2
MRRQVLAACAYALSGTNLADVVLSAYALPSTYLANGAIRLSAGYAMPGTERTYRPTHVIYAMLSTERT